jgi:hypothetical protein
MERRETDPAIHPDQVLAKCANGQMKTFGRSSLKELGGIGFVLVFVVPTSLANSQRDFQNTSFVGQAVLVLGWGTQASVHFKGLSDPETRIRQI